MPNQELIDYIKKSREAGVADSTIRQNLLGFGFSVQDIEESLGGGGSSGVENNIFGNIQQGLPSNPSLPSASPSKPPSILGRILKIFGISLIIIVGIIGGYFALTNYFPQYATYVQPYLGPVLDPLMEMLPFGGSASDVPINTPVPSPTITPAPVYTPQPTPTQQAPTSNADTDMDGLSDLDEAKYKTDPNRPDTDGDTWPDGEEVQNGYNPLGPGRAIPSPTP